MTIRVALTPGEPAGIGPDLAIQIAQQNWPIEIVAVADRNLLLERADKLGLALTLRDYDKTLPAQPQQAGTLTVHHIELAESAVCGELNELNGSYVLETLQFACDHNIDSEFAAIVTGPVHKGIINKSGIAFSGHTEFFAQQSNTPDVVMLLATEGLRVALVTTHIPLAYVAKAITFDRIINVTRILHADLVTKYGISEPKIYVCGLNPHAGEDGHLGREEIEIISPALEQLRQEGMNIVGPLAADTLFQDKYLNNADAVLSMFHDQGLPVLKHKGFGKSVNITLGLPFVRTSVDHGTALELAGTGRADHGSMIVAINEAIKLAIKS